MPKMIMQPNVSVKHLCDLCIKNRTSYFFLKVCKYKIKGQRWHKLLNPLTPSSGPDSLEVVFKHGICDVFVIIRGPDPLCHSDIDGPQRLHDGLGSKLTRAAVTGEHHNLGPVVVHAHFHWDRNKLSVPILYSGLTKSHMNSPKQSLINLLFSGLFTYFVKFETDSCQQLKWLITQYNCFDAIWSQWQF